MPAFYSIGHKSNVSPPKGRFRGWDHQTFCRHCFSFADFHSCSLNDMVDKRIIQFFHTYRTTLVGSVGNYMTSPCGTRCAILAPPNNTTNATQKRHCRPWQCVTNFTNFHPLPRLYSSTFGSRVHQRRHFALNIAEVSCHEDPTALLQMLASSDQAETVPRQVAHGWDLLSSNQGPVSHCGDAWLQ
jgi:hypothetical protein